MSQYPRIIQVSIEGERLLKQFGLRDAGWKFELSNRKQQIGTCSHYHKTIYVSKWWIENSTPEAITDTILHEIAHALVGPNNGHNNIWKQKAFEIGARPVRCGDASIHKTSAKPNYLIQCPKCLRTWKRYRLKKTTARATHCGVPVVVYRVKHEN